VQVNHAVAVGRRRSAGVTEPVPRCQACRSALDLFGSVRAGSDEANLWFCSRCERQTWRLDGRAATMAEVRLLLGRRSMSAAGRRP
jgi:hypothetical protein